MADRAFTLTGEERRLRLTILIGGTILIASTFVVSNSRALFDPLMPKAPSAYSFLLPHSFGGTGAGLEGGHGLADTNHRRARPPAAYAARTPSESQGERAPKSDFIQPAAPGRDQPTQLAFVTPSESGLPIPVSGSASNFPGSGLGPPEIGGPGVDTPGPGPGTGGGSDPGPDPTSPLPEPSTWATMILGFGFIGVLLRRKRSPGNDKLRVVRWGAIS